MSSLNIDQLIVQLVTVGNKCLDLTVRDREDLQAMVKEEVRTQLAEATKISDEGQKLLTAFYERLAMTPSVPSQEVPAPVETPAEAPVDETPTDPEVPVNETPVEQTPVVEVPVEETPGGSQLPPPFSL